MPGNSRQSTVLEESGIFTVHMGTRLPLALAVETPTDLALVNTSDKMEVCGLTIFHLCYLNTRYI